MFTTKIRNSIFSTKPNLTHVIVTKNSKHYFYKYSFTVRDITASHMIRRIQHVKHRMITLLENCTIFQIIRDTSISIPRTLKNQSAGVLRIWAHQCECVLAQRLRRSQQAFCLYTRLWEEHALKEWLCRLGLQISRHGKEFLLSATGVTAYNWQANKIPDKEIKSRMGELKYIQLLKEKTLFCEKCNKEDCSTAKTEDCCHCFTKRTNQKRIFDKWKLFIERKDIMVWRRLHSSGAGHYEYKVYGCFNDVTAEDFLNVQIDSEYRKVWDKTAIVLEVVEKDPDPSSNSEVVYWEMLWPKLFVNRDYVFNRRFVVDLNTNTVVILSRLTEHAACPVKSDKVRVIDYWSEMVIRATSHLDKPGIEFGLTYFDNPGVSIPATVTTWVAMRAMPDFLMALRNASLEYKSFCERHGKQFIYRCSKKIHKLRHDKTNRSNTLLREMEDVIMDNTIFEAQHPFDSTFNQTPSSQTKLPGSVDKEKETVDSNKGYINYDSNQNPPIDTKVDMSVHKHLNHFNTHSPPSQTKLEDFNGKQNEIETSNKGYSDPDVTSIPVIKSDMSSHEFWKYFKLNYYLTGFHYSDMQRSK